MASRPVPLMFTLPRGSELRAPVMQSAFALPQSSAERRTLIVACARRCCRPALPVPVLAVAVCAVVLAGCYPRYTECSLTTSRAANTGTSTGPSSRTPIPLPSRALLTPQAEPNCEFKSTGLDQGTDPNPDLALRMKLDYERQCYRHAAMIARNHLQRLQASVGETMKVVNCIEQSGPFR